VLAPTGDSNEYDSRIKVRLDFSGHLVTIHAGHSDIQYRYFRAESRDGFERCYPVMGCTNVVPCRMKDSGQHRG
jgi:hypothetical protein